MSQEVAPEVRKKELHVALSGMLGRDISRLKTNQIESLIRSQTKGADRRLAFDYFSELTDVAEKSATRKSSEDAGDMIEI